MGKPLDLDRGVIKRWSRLSEQIFRVMARSCGLDHRFALSKPALPSAPSKKSFSSVSSPILAAVPSMVHIAFGTWDKGGKWLLAGAPQKNSRSGPD
jgi:hypothetical protein